MTFDWQRHASEHDSSLHWWWHHVSQIFSIEIVTSHKNYEPEHHEALHRHSVNQRCPTGPLHYQPLDSSVLCISGHFEQQATWCQQQEQLSSKCAQGCFENENFVRVGIVSRFQQWRWWWSWLISVFWIRPFTHSTAIRKVRIMFLSAVLAWW